MPDESNVLPMSRLMRWVAVGVMLAIAVGLYFRDARTLPPLTATPPAPADTLTH